MTLVAGWARIKHWQRTVPAAISVAPSRNRARSACAARRDRCSASTWVSRAMVLIPRYVVVAVPRASPAVTSSGRPDVFWRPISLERFSVVITKGSASSCSNLLNHVTRHRVQRPFYSTIFSHNIISPTRGLRAQPQQMPAASCSIQTRTRTARARRPCAVGGTSWPARRFETFAFPRELSVPCSASANETKRAVDKTIEKRATNQSQPSATSDRMKHTSWSNRTIDKSPAAFFSLKTLFSFCNLPISVLH
jgi:hypothetical protein